MALVSFAKVCWASQSPFSGRSDSDQAAAAPAAAKPAGHKALLAGGLIQTVPGVYRAETDS